MKESRGRRLVTVAALATLLMAGVAGCTQPEEDKRTFRVEFSNETTGAFVSYDISGYVYEALDRDDPREKCDNSDGSCPRAVMIQNGSGPGAHQSDEARWPAWSLYTFEAYVSSNGGPSEFKQFPVDAETNCPGVDPVTLSVRAFDMGLNGLGGVAYDYDFNCP